MIIILFLGHLRDMDGKEYFTYETGHFSCADRASLAGATHCIIYSAKVGACYVAGLVADTEFASAV